MFAPFPQNTRRSVFARLSRVLFVFVLIVSNLLLPLASVARGASVETPRAPAPLQSSDPLPAADLPATASEQAVGADAASAEASVHKPALPLHLALTLAQPVLTVGGSVAVTATLYGDGDDEVSAAAAGELEMTLDLPKGLATAEGEKGKLLWPVTLPARGETLTQRVLLQVEKPKQALKAGVGRLELHVQKAGYAEQSVSTLLGIAPQAEPTVAPSLAEMEVGADGGLVQSADGGVTLLAAPAALASGATLRYTPLYDWAKDAAPANSQMLTVTQQISQTPALTTTTAVSASGALSEVQQLDPRMTIYLPLLSGAEGAIAGALTPNRPLTETAPTTATATITPLTSGNVDAYLIWQLDAEQNGAEVAEFSGDVLLSVSAAELVAQGVNPARLALWTRESDDELWQEVPSSYDAQQQSFSAWLPHFSQFTLAEGLTLYGQLLPSARAFSVDQLSGGATMQIPVETPQGLGGMQPNLSFSYSSVGIDDIYRNSGPNRYHTQASAVGLGWNLAGLSYIARSGGSLDNDTPLTQREFVMALNGQFVRIKYEDGAWHTDPEIFVKVEWTGETSGSGRNSAQNFSPWLITTADGVKYTFGDTGAFTGYSGSSATGTFVQRTNGGDYYRLAREWHLTKLQDPLGNLTEYSYYQEQGTETSCVGGISEYGWYSRAIYPNKIEWSKQTSGIGPQMRVLFNYSYPTERQDYKIDGWASGDCKQSKFSLYSLVSAQVQVKETNGAWQTLRTYELGTGYSPNVTNDSANCKSSNNFCVRLLLHTLSVKGKNGGVLQTYSFGYENANPNTIRLKTADNGYGAVMTYSYTAHRPSCANEVCGAPQGNHWRYAVTETTLADGLGNTLRTLYYYGPTDTASAEWGAVDNSGEFMNYQAVQITSCTINTSCTTSGAQNVDKWQRVSTWQGPRSNPDPRRGRVSRLRVGASEYGTLLSDVQYDWRAYQLNGSGAWSSTPTEQQTRNNDGEYHVVWVRLEATDEWTAGSSSAGAGKLTRQLYESSRQNGAQFGNVTEVQEWSHAESSLDQPTWNSRVLNYASQLSKLRSTVTEYFPNSTTGVHIVDRPARVTVFDGASGACMAETRMVYDNVEGVYVTPPVAGLVKKLEKALTTCWGGSPIGKYDATWAITRYAHDSYGNTTTVNELHSDPTGYYDDITQTQYDDVYHLFPIAQWKANDPLFKETASYFGVNETNAANGATFWGAMAEHCGVNELCVRQSYDEFGRPLRRWEGVSKGSTWTSDASANVQTSYLAKGVSGLNGNVTVEWRAPRCYGNFERRVYNGLGQLVQEQKPQQDWRANVDGCNPGANYPEVDVNYAYDALGRQTRVSTPLATTASWVNRPVSWANGFNQTSYDALGRVTQVTAPNGEVTYQWYGGRATSVEAVGRNGDSNKALKHQEVDGLGNLKRLVTQALINGNWQVEGELTLTHDVLGNLVRVEQPGGVGATTLNYDLGGRKTSMSDPDLGSWSYSYDRQGHLTSQSDARGCVTTLSYNPLGQLTQKQGATCGGGAIAGYSLTYSYGGSGVNRGQLTQVGYSDGRYQKNVSYNTYGLLASETVSIGGAPQSYTTQYSYDSYQRASTVSYPDGDVTTLDYNSMGLAGRLASSQSGTLVDGTSASGAVSNGVGYDEAGRLRTMRLPAGGNLWVSHDNYPWTSSNGNSNGRYWGMLVGTSNGANDRLATWYGYDSFGNVAGYAYTESGVTLDNVGFSYDAQNRLTSGYGKSYSYDNAGRLTNYEGTTLTPASGHPHEMLPAGLGYLWDANGNLTARLGVGGQQYLTWDGENHLASISAGVSESYVYDADGVRVKKSSGDQATYSVGNYYEVMRGGCSGETPAGATNWQAYGSTAVYLDVDTSSCGFSQTPLYVSSLGGDNGHWSTTGGNAIYSATPSGFRIFVRFSNDAAITPAQANSWGWRINWSATPNGIQTAGLCSGQTSSGATNWQAYGSTAVYLDVDTTACGFGETPLYFSSLGGHSGNYATTGGDAIYAATATGFRVYVRFSDDAAITPAQANSYGWQINWVARPKGAKNSSYCTGQTPAGATNWQVYTSSGIYLDVDTTGCGLTSTPRYVTSIGGSGNHFAVTGATAIYFPTSTGFRVYVRYANDAPISPAQANSYGWQINWTALPTTKNQVETSYYSFAGQRIAMKRDGILTYLHSDHLGSTVLETNTSGQIVSDQRYYAYGKQRDTGPVGTDHRFTGQKLDGSGLVYMNARYYDPVIGQFISPDTLVPDATNLLDYNRYGYARGNPMKFNDPSGHYSNDEIMQHYGCSDWGCVEAQFGDGGSHAGLWGWLYILQQAVDGDSVASFNYSGADGIAGTINSALQGIFQRDGSGQISVHATGWSTSGGGESNHQAMSAVMPEVGFATFAGKANIFGSYGMVGAAGVFATNAHHKHNYLSVDPGTVALTGLKAGTGFGPMIASASPAFGPAAPVVAGIGTVYSAIGWTTTAIADFVIPISRGDYRTPTISISTQATSQLADMAGQTGRRISPFIGPTVDLIQGICYGTGCR